MTYKAIQNSEKLIGSTEFSVVLSFTGEISAGAYNLKSISALRLARLAYGCLLGDISAYVYTPTCHMQQRKLNSAEAKVLLQMKVNKKHLSSSTGKVITLPGGSY